MRTTLSLLLVLMATIQAEAQQLDIDNIRDQFFAMDKTAGGAQKLYQVLAKADLTKDPVLLAYRGAASAASAGSVSGVKSKLQYFNHGKSELEKAVSIKPLDAEIRFLRLATQLNAPGFLGYTGEIKNDKAIIFTTLKSVVANHPNAYLYLRICRFLLTYADLSENEKTTVNQLINKFTSLK